MGVKVKEKVQESTGFYQASKHREFCQTHVPRDKLILKRRTFVFNFGTANPSGRLLIMASTPQEGMGVGRNDFPGKPM